MILDWIREVPQVEKVWPSLSNHELYLDIPTQILLPLDKGNGKVISTNFPFKEYLGVRLSGEKATYILRDNVPYLLDPIQSKKKRRVYVREKNDWKEEIVFTWEEKKDEKNCDRNSSQFSEG